MPADPYRVIGKEICNSSARPTGVSPSKAVLDVDAGGRQQSKGAESVHWPTGLASGSAFISNLMEWLAYL